MFLCFDQINGFQSTVIILHTVSPYSGFGKILCITSGVAIFISTASCSFVWKRLFVEGIYCLLLRYYLHHPNWAPPYLLLQGMHVHPSHAGQHELIGIYEVQNNYRYAWYSPQTSCSFAYHVGEARHPGWAPLRYTHVQKWIMNKELWQIINLMIQFSHVYYAEKKTCRS